MFYDIWSTVCIKYLFRSIILKSSQKKANHKYTLKIIHSSIVIKGFFIFLLNFFLRKLSSKI